MLIDGNKAAQNEIVFGLSLLDLYTMLYIIVYVRENLIIHIVIFGLRMFDLLENIVPLQILL